MFQTISYSSLFIIGIGIIIHAFIRPSAPATEPEPSKGKAKPKGKSIPAPTGTAAWSFLAPNLTFLSRFGKPVVGKMVVLGYSGGRLDVMLSRNWTSGQQDVEAFVGTTDAPPEAGHREALGPHNQPYLDRQVAEFSSD